jgi:hypothetical protein
MFSIKLGRSPPYYKIGKMCYDRDQADSFLMGFCCMIGSLYAHNDQQSIFSFKNSSISRH